LQVWTKGTEQIGHFASFISEWKVRHFNCKLIRGTLQLGCVPSSGRWDRRFFLKKTWSLATSFCTVGSNGAQQYRIPIISWQKRPNLKKCMLRVTCLSFHGHLHIQSRDASNPFVSSFLYFENKIALIFAIAFWPMLCLDVIRINSDHPCGFVLFLALFRAGSVSTPLWRTHA
jgi:hypothetical protein